MKLKNKKTGAIGELCVRKNLDGEVIHYEVYVGELSFAYYTLKSLTDTWEDYDEEEPKEYWYIYADKPQRADCGDILEEDFKVIGNYFETKEEAEQAVEKLKAWKRLKDKGIKIGKRRHSAYGGEMYWDCPNGTGISDKEIWLDLDLLFGGEE